MPNIQLFYIFITSLFCSLVLIPPISRLAISIGIFDGNDDRKVHSGSIPRLGGIAIFFAVLLSVILFSDIDRQMRGFLAGAVVIFLTGLTDDLVQIPPKKKFLGEVVAAFIVTLVGDLHLTSLGDLSGRGAIELGALSIPFTVFAIVGVINAINLVDGLDGLAGGVTAIAASAIGLLAYLGGNDNLTGVCLALLGGVLGFLKFNSYPARIFMGDGGSLFLGYCLAFFSIDLAEHCHGGCSVLVPLIILAVPVFDTLFVMGKRLANGKGLFSPDRTHIHHRFMDLGLGHRATVILVYGLSYFLAVYAVLARGLSDQLQLVNLVLLLALFVVFNRVLALLLTGRDGEFLREDASLLNVFAFRRMAHYSKHLLLLVRCLTLAVLGLTLFTFPDHPSVELATVAGLLIFLTALLYIQVADWSNRFLQIVVFFNGAFLIFVAENSGTAFEIAGVPFKVLSAVLFAGLFACSAVLLLLRNKSKILLESPLEYFILFIAVTIPLLPSSFTGPIHLLSVSGKSMVLFLGIKMVPFSMGRGRSIVLAALMMLTTVALRSLF
ncbi:MAG TPA: MraY family glycosyltransferase [Geomonas sp.]|nr:MraY family glycosyltransferase [Geomonas sp.]